jgi:hypothetical protein
MGDLTGGDSPGPTGPTKKKLVKKRGGKKLGKNIVFFHSVSVWCPGSAEKSNLFTVIFFSISGFPKCNTENKKK